MKARTVVARSLVHYRRTHAGVVAGAAVATAVLVGALAVGDSVRHGLRAQSAARIGRVDAALASGDRFFRAELADDLAGAHAMDTEARVAPVLQLPGVVSTAAADARLHVRVHGVDARFFDLAPDPASPAAPTGNEAFVGAELARRLGVAAGEDVVVRVERPSGLPRDMLLALDDVSLALRVRVTAVLDDAGFGAFALQVGPAPPANLFLSREWLAEELEIDGRANLLLVDHGAEPAEGARVLDRALRTAWTLADAELELRSLDDALELRTSRVFLDDPVTEVLERLAGVELTGVLTYFVNEIRAGERATPYSMVTALGPLAGAPSDTSADVAPTATDAIVLGEWLAEDLGAAPGDAVALRYYVLDESRRLVERERGFRVERVVPPSGLAADRELMPDFPGLADAENCRDWEPGIPVDLDRIRPEDEDYWDRFRGTPKAFVALAAGREMWSSRFGSLTAVRMEAAAGDEIRRALHDELDPAALGLFFRDVRTPAQASVDSPTDFGGLFVALSFFLIAAALLLTGLLFLLGVEQRSGEIGLFAALGLRPRAIRGLLVAEGLLLAVVGGGIGVALGLAYTRAVLWGLATFWSEALAGNTFAFHAQAGTVLGGLVASILVTWAVVWIALRRKLRRPSFRLLASDRGTEVDLAAAHGSRAGLVLTVVALAGALAIALSVDVGAAAAGAFFGAGALLLIGGLSACRLALRRVGAGEVEPARSVGALGLRNSTRRPGRSLATVAMMSIGTFLVVAVGANRKEPLADTTERASGTGGFVLYARSSLPVVVDLNTTAGREAFALGDEDMAEVEVVPLRLRAGDDASCLNLAAPQAPRLLAVDPDELARRGAFPFAGGTGGWRLLEQRLDDGAIPAIGDTTSLTWQLKKGVGDTLDYRDERGRPFRVRIVGAIADTVLQGDLVIAEERFEELYPSEGGHRVFLLDAPPERADEVAKRLSRALADVGLAVEPTAARLAAFHAVQNAYIAIFQVLGALGLLLGSVGLATVVLRNALERRAELALASALGFRRARVRWWLLSEHGFLLALGIAVGVVGALLAILPALRTPESDLPLASVALLIAIVAANGMLWVTLATRSAVRRAPIAALSEE